jgi:thiol-disulfide isomerase/thioredoxin
MQPLAYRILLLTVVTAMVLSVAGCAGQKTEPADPDMAGIDAALERGPVLVEFGAVWCHWCDVEKPVIENLSADYSGMTFIYVDVDANATLADKFYEEGVPQMNIIVKGNQDGSYLYVAPGGNTTTDRYSSRIRGYHTYEQLKPLVESALAARTNG